MSIYFCEGFDYIDDVSEIQRDFTTSGDLVSKWENVSGTSNFTVSAAGDGRDGVGKSLKFPTGSNTGGLRFHWGSHGLTPDGTTVTHIGFACKFTRGMHTVTDQNWLYMSDRGSGLQTTAVMLNGTGHVSFGFTTGYSVNDQSDTNPGWPIKFGKWHYVEVIIKNNSTTGEWGLHIDGRLALSYTTLNLYDGFSRYTDRIVFNRADSEFPEWEIDDIVIWDEGGTGLTGNIGDATVVTQMPDGDGTGANTWGTGSYADVDEIGEDGDTTAISNDEAITANAVELYTYPDFGIASADVIHGVQITPYAKALDDTARVLEGVQEDTGSTQTSRTGTRALIPFSQNEYRRLSYMDDQEPGGSAWANTDLDGTASNEVEFGVKSG